MEGAPVAGGPGDEGEEGGEGGDEERGEGAEAFCVGLGGAGLGGPDDPEHGGKDGCGEEALLWAEKDGVGEGCGEDSEPAVEAESAGLPALDREEGEGDAGEAEGFGEGSGDVAGGERAEGCDPEGDAGGAGAEEVEGEAAEDEAGGEVDEALEEHDGGVVLDAEEGEAEDEEEGVSGEADEGGMGEAGGLGESVDAVLEPVFGDIAVDEGVSGDAGRVEDEPEPEGKTEREGGGRRKAQMQSSAIHVGASYCEERRKEQGALTGVGRNHTIGRSNMRRIAIYPR